MQQCRAEPGRHPQAPSCLIPSAWMAPGLCIVPYLTELLCCPAAASGAGTLCACFWGWQQAAGELGRWLSAPVCLH